MRVHWPGFVTRINIIDKIDKLRSSCDAKISFLVISQRPASRRWTLALRNRSVSLIFEPQVAVSFRPIGRERAAAPLIHRLLNYSHQQFVPCSAKRSQQTSNKRQTSPRTRAPLWPPILGDLKLFQRPGSWKRAARICTLGRPPSLGCETRASRAAQVAASRVTCSCQIMKNTSRNYKLQVTWRVDARLQVSWHTTHKQIGLSFITKSACISIATKDYICLGWQRL